MNRHFDGRCYLMALDDGKGYHIQRESAQCVCMFLGVIESSL